MVADEELLDAWRGGDAEAGNELFERHFEGVCRFFRNKLADGVEALLQRTFLACVESKDRFRGDASFRTYLFTIARNELYTYLTRSSRDHARIEPHEISAFDLGPTPSSIVARRKEQRMLLEALRRIPLDHQVALELYYWEELPASELARVLAIPEGTVRTRLRRAKSLLEQALRDLGSPAPDLASTMAGLEDWARSLRDAATPPAASDPP